MKDTYDIERKIVWLVVTKKISLHKFIKECSNEYFDQCNEAVAFANAAQEAVIQGYDLEWAIQEACDNLEISRSNFRDEIKIKTSVDRFDRYVQDLADEFDKVVFEKINSQIAEMLENDSSAREIRKTYLESLTQISRGSRLEVPSAEQHLQDFDELMKHRSAAGSDGMTTLKNINSIFPNSGLGRFIVIGASTSHGKSSFVTPILDKALESGVKTFVQSAELESQLIIQKLIQHRADIPGWLLESGSDDPMYKEIEGVVEEQKEVLLKTAEYWNVQRSDAPLNVRVLTDTIYVKYNEGFKRFIFDRSELFEEVIQNSRNPAAEVSAIGAACRSLAKRLGIDIILLAQSTNEAERTKGGRTDLGTFFYGRSLTTHCTAALGLWNPAVRGQDDEDQVFGKGAFSDHKIRINKEGRDLFFVEIKVLKNTTGPSGGSCLLGFFRDSQRFIDVEDMISFGVTLSDEYRKAQIERIKRKDILSVYVSEPKLLGSKYNFEERDEDEDISSQNGKSEENGSPSSFDAEDFFDTFGHE